MSARVEQGDTPVRVALSGAIDFEHSPAARRALFAAVDSGRAVHVDLSAVERLDSSGIASLIEALERARTTGTALSLGGAREHVMKLLRLARLDTLFELH